MGNFGKICKIGPCKEASWAGDLRSSSLSLMGLMYWPAPSIRSTVSLTILHTFNTLKQRIVTIAKPQNIFSFRSETF